MKVYLDNDIVSAIGKCDVSTSELTILEELLDFFDAKELELVTSGVTAREIALYRGLAKADIEHVYSRLEKVPFIEDHEVVGFHSYWDRFGGESYLLVQDDTISSALWRIGVKRTDAHHLMVAIRAGCDCFITYDKGILHRSPQIESGFSIKAMRPLELLAELNASLVIRKIIASPYLLDAKNPLH
jgi:hypothetical protein